MHKEEDEKNSLEELQKQLKEIFSHANFQVPLKTPEPADNEEDTEIESKTEETLNRIRDFNLKPKEIRDYLNRFVIKQDTAKRVLSVAICDHYNHVRACLQNPELLDKEYSKQNILILGSTGVGKTYLMRTIAKLIGVPFVKADATKFSETGYIGNDVEDLVRDLVKTANGNTELAQYGIVYIDEIDKIASSAGDQGRDVSGRGVQINLLKLMEDTEVSVVNPTDIMSQMRSMMDFGGKKAKKDQADTINTRHILFIVSGAFDKLAENVRKRVDHSRIGFGSAAMKKGDVDLHSYLQQVNTADLIGYGFEPEFIGRLPVRVACESLQEEDLARILTSSEGSILNQYREDFKGYGIHFDITDDAIRSIARQAADEKTGARGLLTVLESLFRSYKFELPSTAIREFEVNQGTIEDPEARLKELLDASQHLQAEVYKNDIERFIESFLSEHGFTLEFQKDACESLITTSIEEDRTIRSICEERFKDFQHGLQIISKNTKKKQFVIDAKTAENPERELSQWVVDSFKELEKDAPGSDSA